MEIKHYFLFDSHYFYRCKMGHNLKGRGDLVLDIRKWSEIVLKFYSFRISFKKYRASTQIRVCVPSAIITGKKNSIILLGNHKFLFKF